MQLQLPPHFNPNTVDDLWLVDYDGIHDAALLWRAQHGIKPAATDDLKTCLLLIDMQVTFCKKTGGHLYVGDRSGTGGLDDTLGATRFIYRELGNLTNLSATLDTHLAWQIFHRTFWLDGNGKHPEPNSIITYDDVLTERWHPNPAVMRNVRTVAGKGLAWLFDYARHYTKKVTEGGRYPLMVWGYHAMLGGLDHALMPHLTEALHFHTIARSAQFSPQIKGGNQLVENFSVFQTEISEDQDGLPLPDAGINHAFINTLVSYDRVVICGEASSHCVRWSISDFLDKLAQRDPALIQKVYVLQDLSSPVVVPAFDFTDMAEQAYRDFAARGVHLVDSTTPMSDWPVTP